MGIWDLTSMSFILGSALYYIWKKTFTGKRGCHSCASASGCSLKELKKRSSRT